MTQILAATDLSARSDRAIQRAFRLANNMGAALQVIHVVDRDLPETMLRGVRDEAERHLHRFCETVPSSDDVNWTVTIAMGDPAPDIAAAAEAMQADLIVTGLHRQRAFFDGMRESTLGYLVRICSQPVLLAADTADHDYERVLAPVDFSPASTAALYAARLWAPDAEISSFHTVHAAISRMEHQGGAMAAAHLSDVEDLMRIWADAGGLPDGVAQPEILNGGITTVFHQKMRDVKPHLVALGAHANHGFTRRVLGTFARELVRDPPTDLLITKPEKD